MCLEEPSLAHSLLEKYTESLCLCGSFQVTFVNFKIFIINMYAIVECFLQFYNEDAALLFEIQILIRFKAGRRLCKILRVGLITHQTFQKNSGRYLQKV